MREGAVRYVDKLTDHDPFVARFDIRAYYESIDHAVLRAQLREARVDPISQRLVRDDLALPDRRCSGKGMVAGGAISPLLGALYLTPLDKVMPRGKGLCGWNNGVEMWFYCLMPNPLHVILVPSDDTGLSRAVGATHRRYSGDINAHQRVTGHLFQGRFGCVAMDEAHL